MLEFEVEVASGGANSVHSDDQPDSVSITDVDGGMQDYFLAACGQEAKLKNALLQDGDYHGTRSPRTKLSGLLPQANTFFRETLSTLEQNFLHETNIERSVPARVVVAKTGR